MNKYFLILLISLFGSQADAMKSGFVSFNDKIAADVLTASVDAFKKGLDNKSTFGQGFKGAAASWTIMGALASGGAMMYQGYTYFRGAQTIANGVVAGSEAINKILEQKEEETAAINKLAQEAEKIRQIQEAKDKEDKEAHDHVKNLSLMQLHMLAAAEAQENGDSHYWQDLYNAKRGDNPYLALPNNNLAHDKQSENPNNQ